MRRIASSIWGGDSASTLAVVTFPPRTRQMASASFRHPPALYLLFGTEMWERLSYYGMRGLLVLYMTDALHGGLAFTDERALRIYGLYTMSVYVTTLAGGALADRILGQRRAVLIGGLLMMVGHFLMAVRELPAFFGSL